MPAAPSSSPGRPSTSIAGWQIIPKPSHPRSARSRALQSKLAAEARGRRITARSTSPSGGFGSGIGIDRGKNRSIYNKTKNIPFPSSTPCASPPLWLPGGRRKAPGLRSPPRTGGVSPARPHGRGGAGWPRWPRSLWRRGAGLGRGCAAAVPAAGALRRAQPSPARLRHGPAPPHVMPGANRPPRLRPLQSPAPGGGRGGRREEGAGPARPPPPTPVNTAEPRPLPGGRKEGSISPRPCAALRGRAEPRPGVPPLGWVGGTGEAAPAPARRCPDVAAQMWLPRCALPRRARPGCCPHGRPEPRRGQRWTAQLPSPRRCPLNPAGAEGGGCHSVKRGAGLGVLRWQPPGARGWGTGGCGAGDAVPAALRALGRCGDVRHGLAASRAAPFCTTYFVSPWFE